MATIDSAEVKRTRALIVALQEAGENAQAKVLEAALTAGATSQREIVQHDAARALASTY